MTKKLEELFNLPPTPTADVDKDMEEALDASAEVVAIHALEAQSDAIDKIERALPEVKGLEASDQEMDDLATLAQDTFKDLMDLGMNVDVRSAPRIFEVAATMLGHSITAKTAKLDKKLKMINLQLKKLQLDRESSAGNGGTIEGTGIAMTRNQLLTEVLNRVKENDANAK